MPNPNLKELEKIASNAAATNGFEVCGVQLSTHMKPITVKVQIRHIGGADISLDDCSSLTAPIGEAIDTSQLLKENYVLEISSPGIDDLLNSDRDFKTFRGFPVEVTFKNKENSDSHSNGLLHERSIEHVQLNVKGSLKRIPRKDVIKVRLTSPTG